ncbi:MAG TPA: DNA polymerase domain-containing protein [Bacteroidota bacterium]|nr:DNA polymerase domain-containing protein [Bacteroidota bacterium]
MEQDSILYGFNNDQKIVAVQHVSDDMMRVYIRSPEGITSKDFEFYPFFLLSEATPLKDFPHKHWLKELDGGNYFRFLAVFSRWSEMWDAIHHTIDWHNNRSPNKINSYQELPILYLRSDPISQFLIHSGITLFKGMDFPALHRLQLHIATYTKQPIKQSRALRQENRIVLISLSDNTGWEYVIQGKNKTEREMLDELIQCICERDPDIIEGHDIIHSTLPFIADRCKLLEIDFTIGRDGSTVNSMNYRVSFDERSPESVIYTIAGRHVMDTLLLVQSYDISKHTIENYGLKHVAQHFGLTKRDRIYIKPERISWYWEHEPDLLVRHALDEVQEIRQLSEYLSPSVFYLTQMVPFNYSSVARLGSAAKIETLMLREYIHQKHSIPKPQSGTQSSGGYTDVFYTGVLGPIVEVDIESLYPSIMLRDSIAPKADDLGIFLHLLDSLTRMRLSAKRTMRTTDDPVEKIKFDTLQSSFKILINSFYGYLGYHRGLFNDVEAAERVTQHGRKLLHQLVQSITAQEGTAVEVDTDGIYFVPPISITDEEGENRFVSSISRELPQGIHLIFNGRYQKILSYKMKNYALLDYNQKIRIKGSSFISRTIERFGKHFIQQAIEFILQRNFTGLHKIYVNLYKDISDHKLSISDFARTETLRDTREQYLKAVEGTMRNPTASYEVALAANIFWKPGDRISYYITGNDANIRGFENCKLAEDWDPNFPDENVSYYLKRLREFAKKFEMYFLPQDYHIIFSDDDLFGFSEEKISILTLPISRESTQFLQDDEDSSPVEFKIWLGES